MCACPLEHVSVLVVLGLLVQTPVFVPSVFTILPLNTPSRSHFPINYFLIPCPTHCKMRGRGKRSTIEAREELVEVTCSPPKTATEDNLLPPHRSSILLLPGSPSLILEPLTARHTRHTLADLFSFFISPISFFFSLSLPPKVRPPPS